MAHIPQRWQACSSQLRTRGSPQSWQMGRWHSPASPSQARSPSLYVQSCRGDRGDTRRDNVSVSEGRHKLERRELPLLQSIKRCSNLCNALLNWEFMILAAEIYGVSGKLFIQAANGCLFIVTAKTKRTKKKQLCQRFLLLSSSVVDTHAILIAVVDQTVLVWWTLSLKSYL